MIVDPSTSGGASSLSARVRRKSLFLGVAVCIVSCIGCSSSGADNTLADAAGSGALGGSAGASESTGGKGSSTASAGASGSAAGGSAGASGGATAGSAGSSGSGVAGGGAIACPAAPAPTGSRCSAVGECTYLDCSGAGQVTTRCNGTTISVETLPCGPTRCGGVGGSDCAADQVCIQFSGIGTLMHQCVANPCAGSALTCECAGAKCAANSCSVNGAIVTCGGICPEC